MCAHPNYSSGEPQKTPAAPVWSDEWGAIATDRKGGLGEVTEMPTETDARRAAMLDCASHASDSDREGNCKLNAVYSNECAVIQQETPDIISPWMHQ